MNKNGLTYFFQPVSIFYCIYSCQHACRKIPLPLSMFWRLANAQYLPVCLPSALAYIHSPQENLQAKPLDKLALSQNESRGRGIRQGEKNKEKNTQLAVVSLEMIAIPPRAHPLYGWNLCGALLPFQPVCPDWSSS